jgi:hypothetical protein
MGETSFYVAESFSAKQMYEAITGAFSDPAIHKVICGWTDYELNNCDVFLLLINKENKSGIPLTINKIYNLYN